MNISEIIKQAREKLGLTQEDLAEKLEVSRQAVSKWELGASVPSPENLELLEEVLGVNFPPPEENAAPEEAPPAGAKPPFWNWKRVVLLVFGVLIVSALLSIWMFTALKSEKNADVPRHAEPYVTGIYFFSVDAAPLYPDLGDGWNSLTAGERVLVAVTFEEGTEDTVDAVSLFLTPTGTETLQYREQIAVQAAGEGRDFALFAWDIPQEGLMGHLEVVLECGGGLRVTDTTMNVTASSSPRPVETPGVLAIRPEEIHTTEGDIGQYVTEVYGVPWVEVEWTSSDPSVARVANNGRIFIEGPGEAVITASWKEQTAECLVRVEAVGTEGNTDLDNPTYAPADGISYEARTLAIPIGATLFMDEPDPLPLAATGAPEDEIVWTSSNPAVVEVTDIGAIFPVSPGKAVVTAEWNGQAAECQVEVFTGTIPTDVPGISKVVR